MYLYIDGTKKKDLKIVWIIFGRKSKKSKKEHNWNQK